MRPLFVAPPLAQGVLLPILAVGLSYALGGILGADLVGRWRGFDARGGGSGNPGATNVYRTVGALPAFLVLLWDAGKGWLAVCLPVWMHCGHAAIVASVCALAVLLGHVRPPWRRHGTGGKGVATFLGVLVALVPPAAGVFVVIWAAVLVATRYVSLASLVAGAAAVVVWGLEAPPERAAVAWAAAALAYALVLWRHRGNVRRLCAGEEPRLSRLRAR